MAEPATAKDSSQSPAARRGDRSANGEARCVLLIGMGPLVDATERALQSGGASVQRLEEPNDLEIREALDHSVDRVVVVSRFDHVSLRMALVVEHLRPGMPSIVTIFDPDVAAHLQRTVSNVRVLSMADIVVPALAGPCLDPGIPSLSRGASEVQAIKALDGVPRPVAPTWSGQGRLHRAIANLDALARPFDASARILVAGLAGFFGALLLETVVTTLAEHYSLVDALYASAKVAVTVGPNPAADHAGAAFKLFSTVEILATLAFAAVFTAGLVNRLLDRRLTGIVGPSSVPRRGHVVVVGLGQVGLRLCMMFRALDIPVVAVEQNPNSKNVARAKDQHLPVVIGSGASQRLLRRISIHRARALAAVTSDEVENIAIAIAARGLREDLNIALRAGDGDATSETQSLFEIGVVRDVYRIGGTALAAAALDYEVDSAFPLEGTLYLVADGPEILPYRVREDQRDGEDSGPRGSEDQAVPSA